MSYSLSNLSNGSLGMAKTVGVSASVRAISSAIKANSTPQPPAPTQPNKEEHRG